MQTQQLQKNMKEKVKVFEDGGIRLLKKGQKGLVHAIFSRFGLVLVLLLLQFGALFSLLRWFGQLLPHYLGGTALVFFCCSAYVLTTRKDMSFLGGMLMAGVVVVLVGMVANIFLQLPALHLAISAVFILISSGAILFETSNIIRGGETNYIRATVSLYVSLYNIFVSLLSILGFASRD